MKKRKKILISISVLVFTGLLLYGGLLIATGGKKLYVNLADYSVSEDGNKITLELSIESILGDIKTIEVNEGGDNKYIKVYSTFGLNSNLGEKRKIEIDGKNGSGKIYLYSRGGYKEVLEKDINENKWDLTR